MRNFFKKISSFQIFVFCFLMCNVPLFADISQLGTNVKNQLKGTAEQVMSVLNTVIASVGIVYVIIIGFIFIFKPDTFKENSKVLIGALVALGALYGITGLGLQAFGT